MSDALGIHLAQEADPESSSAHIWAATISTFVTKLLVALTFALPLIFLPLGVAVVVSVGWGLIVIVLLSYYLARAQKASVLPAIAEHLAIAIVVVVLAHFIGVWVQGVFS
jgi:VIT1/CCC1 family predicted Fe2+/Mn2+ transporter